MLKTKFITFFSVLTMVIELLAQSSQLYQFVWGL